MILREKRQNIRALFEFWAPKYATYATLTQEQINADDDIFEAVTDVDTERGQICLAILEFAKYASDHFDFDDEGDRFNMKNVALNVVKKKAQLDAMPFLLQQNKDDEDMVKSCRLPFYEEMLPPQIGKKRCHFDASETSTQLPEGKRHAGLSPIPAVVGEGDVREIAVSAGPEMEVGSDGAILNRQQYPLPRDIGSPIMPQYNLLLVPDADATQYKPLATKYGPQPRRNSHSVTPNIMDVREGDA